MKGKSIVVFLLVVFLPYYAVPLIMLGQDKKLIAWVNK